MLICGKDSRVTVQVYKPKSIVAIHVAMKSIRYLGGCAGGMGGIACFGHGTYGMPTRDENYVTEMQNKQDEHWSESRVRVLCPGWDALELYGETEYDESFSQMHSFQLLVRETPNSPKIQTLQIWN